MIQDFKFAFRQLFKAPAFTFTAVTVLALGIGANTAIFSALNALLLRPLPVKNIDQLVFSIALREGFDPFGSSYIEYGAYRDRAHSFASSGLATQRSFSLVGRGEPERVRGAVAMAEYVTTLGVKPLLGRTFSAADDKPGWKWPITIQPLRNAWSWRRGRANGLVSQSPDPSRPGGAGGKHTLSSRAALAHV